jgi:MFS family permease
MSFIEKTMSVDKEQVDSLMFIALMLGTPFFLVFGWLSDKIGRKWIMMAGMLIAIVSYRPIYENMYQTTNVANKVEVSSSNSMVNNVNTVTTVYTDSTVRKEIQKTNTETGAITTTVKLSINGSDKQKLILLVFIQVLFVTMVYGPIAAFLVEMFPTKIRYTSMSLPYHIGNGVFGGLLPAVATYLATNAKTSGKADWYLEGLWYPIGVAAVCLVIGVIYINGKDKEIND